MIFGGYNSDHLQDVLFLNVENNTISKQANDLRKK